MQRKGKLCKTHLPQPISKRILRSRLVDLCDSQQRLGSVQGVDLDAQDHRHPAEEEDHKDRPGKVVGSCSSSKGVGGVGGDDHGDDGKEETHVDEGKDANTQHSSIESG